MKIKWAVTGIVVIFFLTAATYVLAFVGPALFAGFKVPSLKVAGTTATKNSNNSSLPLASGIVQNSSLKNYFGVGFTLQYPNNWGLLTCSNSYNIELDPTSSSDQLGVICDSAMKPISIIQSSDLSNCGGENVKIGNVNVLKSQITTQNYTTYQWCTLTQPIFVFSNRVSTTTSYAATQKPFINEVESIIASLSFSR